MKLHGNAALSWNGRRSLAERVVVEGWTVTAAAGAAGVSVRCARKWVGSYRLEGKLGLCDRSSAPKRVANRTAPERVEAIAKLRRLRFTAAEIAETLEMALSTVSGILARIGWAGAFIFSSFALLSPSAGSGSILTASDSNGGAPSQAAL